jgi:hypothetical protein
MGMLWHERPFKDFILLLDWKVSRREDNSGIFVRFPDPGDEPWVAANQGYEVHIDDVGGETERTGSVYGMKDASEVSTVAPGGWNHYEIRAVAQSYSIWVNGRKVNEFSGDRSLEGRIGLQNHDPESAVAFRNIRVVELR